MSVDSFLASAESLDSKRAPASLSEEKSITASEYAAFLNAVATTKDSHHLYDEKIRSDPFTACITRSGQPGHYYYTIIRGRENIPISYINSINKACYNNWLKGSASIGNQNAQDSISSEGERSLDDSGNSFSIGFLLKSSNKDFFLINDISLTLLAFGNSPLSSNDDTSWIKDATFLVTTLFLAKKVFFSTPVNLPTLEPVPQHIACVGRADHSVERQRPVPQYSPVSLSSIRDSPQSLMGSNNNRIQQFTRAELLKTTDKNAVRGSSKQELDSITQETFNKALISIASMARKVRLQKTIVRDFIEQLINKTVVAITRKAIARDFVKKIINEQLPISTAREARWKEAKAMSKSYAYDLNKGIILRSLYSFAYVTTRISFSLDNLNKDLQEKKIRLDVENSLFSFFTLEDLPARLLQKSKKTRLVWYKNSLMKQIESNAKKLSENVNILTKRDLWQERMSFCRISDFQEALKNTRSLENLIELVEDINKGLISNQRIANDREILTSFLERGIEMKREYFQLERQLRKETKETKKRKIEEVLNKKLYEMQKQAKLLDNISPYLKLTNKLLSIKIRIIHTKEEIEQELKQREESQKPGPKKSWTTSSAIFQNSFFNKLLDNSTESTDFLLLRDSEDLFVVISPVIEILDESSSLSSEKPIVDFSILEEKAQQLFQEIGILVSMEKSLVEEIQKRSQELNRWLAKRFVKKTTLSTLLMQSDASFSAQMISLAREF